MSDLASRTNRQAAVLGRQVKEIVLHILKGRSLANSKVSVLAERLKGQSKHCRSRQDKSIPLFAFLISVIPCLHCERDRPPVTNEGDLAGNIFCIGRHIEPYGVDYILQRLGFSHAKTTIPKWLQVGHNIVRIPCNKLDKLAVKLCYKTILN